MTAAELSSFVHAIPSSEQPQRDLRAVARAIGASLPRQDLRMLDDVAHACRRAAEMVDEAVGAGLTSLSLVITSYANEIAHRMSSLDLELLRERTSLVKLMRALSPTEARRPADLAKDVGLSPPEITKRLRELRELGLAEIVPGAVADRRVRPHLLTMNGEAVRRELDATESLTTATAGHVALDRVRQEVLDVMGARRFVMTPKRPATLSMKNSLFVSWSEAAMRPVRSGGGRQPTGR